MMNHSKRDESFLHVTNQTDLHYLIKPVIPAELYNAVHSVLFGAHQNQTQAFDPIDTAHDSVLQPAFKSNQDIHILVAEDNQVNQKIVMRTLEKFQYTLSVANDGEEALEQWKNNPVDLILMDVQMPKMDGLQATQAIRELEKGTGKRVPIIALTAHAMKGDKERCLEAGMDDYLQKPVNPNILKERVIQIIRSSAIP